MAEPRIDVQVMAGSLPRYFRRSAADFPGQAYLAPDPGAAIARHRVSLPHPGRAPGMSAIADAGNVKFSPNKPTLTALADRIDELKRESAALEDEIEQGGCDQCQGENK